jgi:hypothetical protein
MLQLEELYEGPVDEESSLWTNKVCTLQSCWAMRLNTLLISKVRILSFLLNPTGSRKRIPHAREACCRRAGSDDVGPGRVSTAPMADWNNRRTPLE